MPPHHPKDDDYLSEARDSEAETIYIDCHYPKIDIERIAREKGLLVSEKGDIATIEWKGLKVVIRNQRAHVMIKCPSFWEVVGDAFKREFRKFLHEDLEIYKFLYEDLGLKRGREK